MFFADGGFPCDVYNLGDCCGDPDHYCRLDIYFMASVQGRYRLLYLCWKMSLSSHRRTKDSHGS